MLGGCLELVFRLYGRELVRISLQGSLVGLDILEGELI